MNSRQRMLGRIFALLQRLQPVPEEYDVLWRGPFFIPRSGQWHPSTFMLYRGTLFVSLYIGWRWHGLSWRVGSDVLEADRGFFSDSDELGEDTWQSALTQIERRLRTAVRNPEAYNRRVQRYLPLSCRTGKVERCRTWPKGTKRPLAIRQLRRLEGAMQRTRGPCPIPEMTLARYLSVVATAYDAVFKELRTLSPPEKYKARADGRHGGLMELPPEDAAAFSGWYHSGSWAGSHPWEIVFGHPHGILISPCQDFEGARWSYRLSVSSEGWHATAARMALALVSADVPFEFFNWSKVTSALAGVDEVEVGPGLRQIHYDELRDLGADALSAIRWDPIPALAHITPEQMERVRKQLGYADEPAAEVSRASFS